MLEFEGKDRVSKVGIVVGNDVAEEGSNTGVDGGLELDALLNDLLSANENPFFVLGLVSSTVAVVTIGSTFGALMVHPCAFSNCFLISSSNEANLASYVAHFFDLYL